MVGAGYSGNVLCMMRVKETGVVLLRLRKNVCAFGSSRWKKQVLTQEVVRSVGSRKTVDKITVFLKGKNDRRVFWPSPL